MWAMLQQDEPGDFVLATGEAHSVEDFVSAAFDVVGLGWSDYVIIDSDLFRPAEVEVLVGNPGRAHSKLGWIASTTFEDLVRIMVEAELLTVSIQ
jgi:GDPmannose 4,6-dehydratase